MHKKSGFTVLELIVCLVVVAIIATTAMVRFLEIQSDARANKIREIAANLQTGIDMIYAKSMVEGVENECSYAEPYTRIYDYPVCHAYPIAYISSVSELMDIPPKTDGNGNKINQDYPLSVRNIKITDKDLTITPTDELVAAIHFTGTTYTFFPKGGYCQVLYQPEKEPQIVVLDSAC